MLAMFAGMYEVSRIEEPGAVVSHAGICAGNAEQSAFLPRLGDVHIKVTI